VSITAVVAGVMVFGAIASASVSIPENPIPVSSGQTNPTVTVTYTVDAGKALYFDECKKDPADPTFNFAKDCSGVTEWQVNPNENTGSGTLDFTLFRGDEPDGDGWGCYAPGDTPSPGSTKFTTCYIRVTEDSPSNNAQAQSIAFTFAAQGAPVPESPWTIALPFAAVAVIGGAFVINRRRASRSPIQA
jgi:hypothetical protein